MNIEIKKVSKDNKEVIDFLIEENLKIYYELHPENLKMWNESYHDYLLKRSRKNFVDIMSENPTIYAAYIQDSVIGCGFIDDTGYLNSLFVKEEYRNQLIGSNILEKLIEDCSNFDIIRVDARIDAISFYKKFFFTETGLKNRNSVAMQLERSHYGK